MPLKSNRNKILTYFISASCFVYFLYSCATNKYVEQKQTFTFSYTSRHPVAAGSAETSVILVKPGYADNFIYKTSELFSSYAAGFSADFESMLTARGFTLKKDCDNEDEILYGDKKDADVEIKISLLPELAAMQGQWKNSGSKQAPSYTFSGVANLTGKILLAGTEPLSGEKIWEFRLNIPEQDSVILITGNHYNHELVGDEFLNDPGIYNAIGPRLQQTYEGIMKKIEIKLDATEFKALKPQIKELKSKSIK
jgi:hypothetical protein